jgi:hypothetical protein
MNKFRTDVLILKTEAVFPSETLASSNYEYIIRRKPHYEA